MNPSMWMIEKPHTVWMGFLVSLEMTFLNLSKIENRTEKMCYFLWIIPPIALDSCKIYLAKYYFQLTFYRFLQ